MNAGVVTGVVIQHTDVTLLARLTGQGGTPITRASLSSIAWSANDLNTGLSLGAGTFVIASTVFDQLVQNDPRWTKDAQGYNFLGIVPAATFPATPPPAVPVGLPQTIPDSVQVEVTFTPVAGGIFAGVWQFTPVPRFS